MIKSNFWCNEQVPEPGMLFCKEKAIAIKAVSKMAI